MDSSGADTPENVLSRLRQAGLDRPFATSAVGEFSGKLRITPLADDAATVALSTRVVSDLGVAEQGILNSERDHTAVARGAEAADALGQIADRLSSITAVAAGAATSPEF